MMQRTKLTLASSLEYCRVLVQGLLSLQGNTFIRHLLLQPTLNCIEECVEEELARGRASKGSLKMQPLTPQTYLHAAQYKSQINIGKLFPSNISSQVWYIFARWVERGVFMFVTFQLYKTCLSVKWSLKHLLDSVFKIQAS